MLPLAAVHGASGGGEKVALIALALISALALIVRPAGGAPARLRAGALIVALLGSPALLAADVWSSSPLVHLRAHPALLAGGIALGLLLLAGIAFAFARAASALPLAAISMLPFRVPVTIGGTTANLLLPLYVVIAAGVLSIEVPRLLARGAGRGRPERGAGRGRAAPLQGGDGPAAAPRQAPQPPGEHPAGRALRVLLAAFVLLYAIQAAYSIDFSKALQNVVFFYVPFSLLLCLLLEVRWTPTLLKRALAVAVGLGVLFAAAGFVEYGTRSLLFNKALVASNVYGNYFRVNSLFYDPNIYGRYLALVMVLLATVAMFAASRRLLVLCTVCLAWLWLGLIISISETSIVALLAGLAVIGAVRWGVRRAALGTLAIAAVGLILFFAAPASLHFGVNGKGGSLNTATSGRASLIGGGLHLFEDRPLAGFGSGSFAAQYTRHQKAGVASSSTDSHTTPVTIAAEQGIVGLLAYAALLLCCLLVLFGPLRGASGLLAIDGRAPPAFQNGGASPALTTARIAIATAFVALFVHTLAYADFLEDPITWTLIALGISLAAAHRRSAPAAAASLGTPPLRTLAAGEQQRSAAG